LNSEKQSAAEEALLTFLNRDRVRRDEPMALHCSFRAGGKAALYAEVTTFEELVRALSVCGQAGIPFFVMGRGTNLLVSDGGFDGLILQVSGNAALPREMEIPGPVSGMEMLDEDAARALLSDSVSGITVSGNRILAGAGVSLSVLAKCAADHGLSGLEFASGIPGSVGGALVMNAGAYGGEMKQVVESVFCLLPGGEFWQIDNANMKFGYRESMLRHLPAIAMEAVFTLTPGNPDTIRATMNDLNARRREKQPLEYPSAGSTFKRPEGYFAGKLIQDAGLAGYRVGGAEVSTKHCGFVINKDHATATDICTLIETIQQKVYENSGVRLEREVIILGS
jgi:UDP-N-acetylmuramate dehydrogenase